MKLQRIFYTKPSITELEILYATDAVTYGWGDKCYEYIKPCKIKMNQEIE